MAISEDYTLYDSIYITFSKNKKIEIAEWWLPAVKERFGWEGSGCGYRRARGGTLLVIGIFCILTV